jgi:secondary thiamine-phosphate synthase enzyme
VARWVAEAGIRAGLLTAFCRHTSASLALQENADPDVQKDLLTALDRLAPRGAGYVHRLEGPDDMPAHIRAMLTGAAVPIPVVEGRLALGTWQGLYLVEHRDRPHRREVLLHVAGA